MKQRKGFNITATDRFDANEYPMVTDELASLAEYTTGMSPVYKEDIIISYLKGKPIKAKWISANPLLTTLITADVLPTATIESLFRSSRNNPAFSKDLETFIRQSLAAK